MNRFEAMLASPTLSGKEMAMQVKMQREIPREEANILRSEMFVPKVRLYDELTTLRFRRPGSAEESEEYRKFCSALSGSSATPIPYRFFKAEFQRIQEELSGGGSSASEDEEDDLAEGSVSERVVRRAKRRRAQARSKQDKSTLNTVEKLKDPWRLQAYAALSLRVAQAAETEDPKNAAVAWMTALKLYRKFFGMAKPEESGTYKVQTEEKLRADTVEAWEGFLPQLLEELSGRVNTYIQEKKPDSVAACLDVLQSDQAKLIDRFVGDQTLQSAFLPYIDAIKKASSLKEAAALYESVPAALLQKDSGQDAPRAMLAAMCAELERLKKGTNSVALVLQWAAKLKAMDLYQNGSPLVKKAAEDFFEACGAYAREMLGEKDRERQQKYADCLMSIMPEDIVIVITRDSDGSKKERRRDDLLGMPTASVIREKFSDRMGKCRSEREAEELGKEVWKYIQSVKMANCQWQDLQREILQTLIITIQKSGMKPQYQLAFFSSYADNLPIRDKDLKTVGGFKDMLKRAVGGSRPTTRPDLIGRSEPPGLSKGLVALARFAKAEDGSPEKLEYLLDVVKWALDHPDEDVNGDTYYSLAETCCRNAFIAALNKKNEVSSREFERDYKLIMTLAVSFLPKDYKFPAGSGRTIGSEMLVKLLDIRLDSDVRSRADRARKKLGLGGGGGDSTFLKALIRGVVRVLLALITPGIITLVFFLMKKPLPIGWSYARLLFFWAAIFQLPLEMSKVYLEKESSKFWTFIRLQASMLYVPLMFVFTLQHFSLSIKLWMIIVGVLYGLLWLLCSVAILVSKD